MVKRRNLRPDPARAFADLLAKQAAQAKALGTVPTGVKDLGARGDVTWPSTDTEGAPVQKSVKRFSVELDDTTAQAEALAEKLAEAEALLESEQDRLDAARDLLDSLDVRVDGVAERPFTARGLAPPQGAPMGTQWLTPEDHLYVRVPCEEVPDGV